jgi:glycogen synthase
VDWDPASRTGTGFLFSPHRPEDIPAAMRRAVRAAATTEVWDELVSRVAHLDLSWRTVGVRHAELGREAIRAARAAAATSGSGEGTPVPPELPLLPPVPPVPPLPR